MQSTEVHPEAAAANDPATASAATVRSRPKAPQRAPGRARIEAVLDAADRVIAARGVSALSLPVVAAEAGAPASSLYHFFPSMDALLTALLERYNARMDKDLEAAMATAPRPSDWRAMLLVLMQAGRDFHDAYPVYTDLLARASASTLLRRTDDAHMMAQGARLAQALDAAFHLPPVPDLAKRLGLAVAMTDRLWAFLPLENGRISDFAFEESVRAVISYVANYLPAFLTPKEPV